MSRDPDSHEIYLLLVTAIVISGLAAYASLAPKDLGIERLGLFVTAKGL